MPKYRGDEDGKGTARGIKTAINAGVGERERVRNPNVRKYAVFGAETGDDREKSTDQEIGVFSGRIGSEVGTWTESQKR